MYPARQLVKHSIEDIAKAQTNEDEENRQYLKDNLSENSLLSPHEQELILEYYTETMEKYRLIYNAFIKVFSNGYVPGYPKNIYGIDLSDGSVDTDKDGRRISYGAKVLAPCSSTAAQFIDASCGKVYVIFPPIKSAKRTLEKVLDERTREIKQFKQEQLKRTIDMALEAEQNTKLEPFHISKKASKSGTLNRPLIQQQADLKYEPVTTDFIHNIARENILPRDIYRLSILAKHRKNLEDLISELEQKFPDYIKFEDGERNQYKKHLSELKRGYIDIKRIAYITDPKSHCTFAVEFQFKQTNMFYAHIRSHRAYEEYRILDAKYKKLKETFQNKKSSSNSKAKTELTTLAKKRDDKLQLCEQIHKSALHQSNLYLMQEIMWMDDSARGMGNKPNANGHYEASIQFLKDNYIVENYEPFDGFTAFATHEKEHLNKSYFLKLLGKLPESFDELSKNAPEHIKKIWNTLEAGDVDKFKNITNTAIRYQSIVREIQKERQTEEKSSEKTILEKAIINTKQNCL